MKELPKSLKSFAFKSLKVNSVCLGCLTLFNINPLSLNQETKGKCALKNHKSFLLLSSNSSFINMTIRR